MGLSKKNQMLHAMNLGKAIAESLFKDMQDQDNRGPKFTWEKFPDIAARFAANTCGVSFPHQVSESIKTLCGAIAKQRAIELVETASAPQ